MITEKTYPFAKKESIILNFCKNAKSKIVVIIKNILISFHFLNIIFLIQKKGSCGE